MLLQNCILASSCDKCCFEQEKKSPEKGSPRSRIPRLVLHPFRPKDKGSPLSDSPFSEEEGGKECDMSSDHSKRTISTNSFCSGKKISFSPEHRWVHTWCKLQILWTTSTPYKLLTASVCCIDPGWPCEYKSSCDTNRIFNSDDDLHAGLCKAKH